MDGVQVWGRGWWSGRGALDLVASRVAALEADPPRAIESRRGDAGSLLVADVIEPAADSLVIVVQVGDGAVLKERHRVGVHNPLWWLPENSVATVGCDNR